MPRTMTCPLVGDVVGRLVRSSRKIGSASISAVGSSLAEALGERLLVVLRPPRSSRRTGPRVTAAGQQRPSRARAATSASRGDARLTRARSSSLARRRASRIAAAVGTEPQHLARASSASTCGAAAPKIRRDVGGGAALGAVPGRQDRAVERRSPRRVLADGRADHGTERAERLGAGVERRAGASSIRAGDGAARRRSRACCTSGPSLLEVSASTNTPASCRGRSRPSGRATRSRGRGWP